MSQLDSIFAITAIDGRYRSKVENLAHITSEFGLIKYRTAVECQWVLFLSDCEEIPEIPSLDKEDRAFVAAIAANFDAVGATRIKEIEATTNHDVKAVEYYLKEQFALRPNLQAINEWVHFGCTSEDINNTAYGLMVKAGVEDVLLVHMDQLIKVIDDLAQQYAELPMLSRTHGQTASPTTLGKEMKNVAARLYRQRQQLAAVEILAKFNGAVGNFNAHLSAYPDLPWAELSAQFIQRLGLVNNPWTTQIEPHDYLAEVFHCIMRFNQIVLDFDRDIWSYISINYFKQRKVEGETGSSTMPHKINPIDFENSEGNIGIANALFEHLAAKLPISRLQRDLTDSTVLRNVGIPFAHTLISYRSLLKGLDKLLLNNEAIDKDLEENWAVVAEAIQTILRRENYPNPYEALKELTRLNSKISKETISDFIDNLNVENRIKKELKKITPTNYTGI